ncbi:MAG: hypothetical protein U0354_10935 [Candidatus Sericytochromatia bacterium]
MLDLISRAVNAQSNITGIGCSVIVNQNDQNLATIVFSSANKKLTEASTRLSTNSAATGLANIQSADVGLTKSIEIIKTTHSMQLTHCYYPQLLQHINQLLGDVISFDSTGSLVNNSEVKMLYLLC